MKVVQRPALTSTDQEPRMAENIGNITVQNCQKNNRGLHGRMLKLKSRNIPYLQTACHSSASLCQFFLCLFFQSCTDIRTTVSISTLRWTTSWKQKLLCLVYNRICKQLHYTVAPMQKDAGEIRFIVFFCHVRRNHKNFIGVFRDLLKFTHLALSFLAQF